jgi:hypothetical protein
VTPVSIGDAMGLLRDGFWQLPCGQEPLSQKRLLVFSVQQ